MVGEVASFPATKRHLLGQRTDKESEALLPDDCLVAFSASPAALPSRLSISTILSPSPNTPTTLFPKRAIEWTPLLPSSGCLLSSQKYLPDPPLGFRFARKASPTDTMADVSSTRLYLGNLPRHGMLAFTNPRMDLPP